MTKFPDTTYPPNPTVKEAGCEVLTIKTLRYSL